MAKKKTEVEAEAKVEDAPAEDMGTHGAAGDDKPKTEPKSKPTSRGKPDEPKLDDDPYEGARNFVP